MNSEKDKIREAIATGAPVFFTRGELEWLTEILVDFAGEFRADQMSDLDRLDLLMSVSIGIKCAKELCDQEDPKTN